MTNSASGSSNRFFSAVGTPSRRPEAENETFISESTYARSSDSDTSAIFPLDRQACYPNSACGASGFFTGVDCPARLAEIIGRFRQSIPSWKDDIGPANPHPELTKFVTASISHGIDEAIFKIEITRLESRTRSRPSWISTDLTTRSQLLSK
jgi:hypothetical protein